MAHQVQEYRDAGMDGHVSKPIEVSALYAELCAVLEAGDEDAADTVAAQRRSPPAA
jgi:CheY-like chemotaxis protein